MAFSTDGLRIAISPLGTPAQKSDQKTKDTIVKKKKTTIAKLVYWSSLVP